MYIKLPVAKSGDKEIFILSNMVNRHGIISGATGTGKTVTLQVLAESFSSIGVPVFLADIKGDLSGISKSGELTPKMQERLAKLGIKGIEFQGFPVVFWDIFGKDGHPIRITISELGPILLGRILDLNETQSGILSLIFKMADEKELLILDFKDLKAVLKYAAENTSLISKEYGNINATSIGTIQRKLIELEQQGAEIFFGEPAFDITNFIECKDGLGVVNILDATTLFNYPLLYSTFLLWLLSELFEILPEVGDLEKPKFVFFFDEAHLLFKDAPKIFIDNIEKVVRLIRSKGVGVYFITQNPMDIPQNILGQLGNRFQHGLRAFTPNDQKVIKAIAQNFRQNPSLNLLNDITELGLGEAIISLLDEEGRPSIAERGFILPPKSKIGPITQEEKKEIIKRSKYYGVYEKIVDRESAYELLTKRLESENISQTIKKEEKKDKNINQKGNVEKNPFLDLMLDTIGSTLGGRTGKKILRGVFGTILGKKGRR
ncbi:MAG TPA: DUF853 family protein [Spirochaetota bacterium]|nr:DUF853 family protein [Spirochaetota bacterium]HOL57291.1 DUF853 family protein [Spirochaetota bacterium]HPP05191.1 DUF853 family protein [Spirochaetota bacterium]